jgi:polysaccharide pyruvyl transferase WcaK-like protein
MSRVFLYGYYGCGNVGDDLLLSVVAEQILALRSDARVVVKCLQIPPVKNGGRIQFETCEAILADPDLPRWKKACRYSHRMWKALKGVSIFIFGGGTLFHAGKGMPVNLLLLLSVVCMARLRGAQVYALGVGVSPLASVLPAFLMSGILLLSRDFAVRDESSLANCRKIPASSKIRLTADLVFSLETAGRNNIPKSSRIIGVTLAASDIGGSADKHDMALRELARALNTLILSGWEIQFLSFQELAYSKTRISDSSLADKLTSLGLASPINVRRISSDPGTMEGQIADIGMVVGMRFHAHVLAALTHKPFVGFGRDHKVQNLCKVYGFPFIDLDELTESGLLAAIRDACSRRPDPILTADLASRSAENFRILSENLLAH